MVSGSCLCGGIAFEIDGKVTPIQLCHAQRCRKLTGSAFAPELAAKESALRWIRGEELLSSYEAPLLREPPAFRRDFCRVCGSPMPVPLEGTGYIVLLAGVLDDDPGTEPFRHIFLAEAAPWDRVSDDLLRYEERPPPAERIGPARRRS